MLYVAVPLRHDGALLGILRTALPTAGLERRLVPLHRGIMLTAALLFGVLGVTAWRLNRSLNEPLKAMRQWTAELAAGKPPGRLIPNGPETVASLAVALDRMAVAMTGHLNRVSQQPR